MFFDTLINRCSKYFFLNGGKLNDIFAITTRVVSGERSSQ